MLPPSSRYISCILKCEEIFLRAVGSHVGCYNPKYNIRITFDTNINPHNFVDHSFILQRPRVFVLLSVESIMAFQTANKFEIL